MHKKIISVLLILSVCTLFAEYNPPAGEESYFRLLSPWLLGTGTSTVSTDAPASAVWNPAAAAATQRTTFDLGYVGLYDTRYDEGLAGSIINLGASIPTKVGVITSSGHFLTSNYEGIDLGTMGMLNLGFAKDVFEDFYFGGGLNLYLGENDSSGWGSTADLGFIHFLGKYRALNNFRWGLVAKDIGLGYDTSDVYGPIPSPFTLQAGAAFTPWQRDGFSLDLHGDIITPSFQNLRLDAGMLANFDNFIQVGISSALDFKDIADGEFDSYRWIPSVGVRMSFQTDLSSSELIDFSSRGWAKGDVQPHIGIAPLAGGAWGAGAGVSMPLGIIDESPPAIKLDLGDMPYNEDQPAETESTDSVSMGGQIHNKNKAGLKNGDLKGLKLLMTVQDAAASEKSVPEKNVLHKIPGAIYLSPNNDGIQDDLSFPFQIEDSRYIKGYELVIENEDGEVIRSIGNKEERPQEITFKVFLNRLFSRKSGIPIPETLRWDGTTEEGTVAPDGVYRFYIAAWDDNGNRSKSEEYPLVVDTRPPTVTVEEIPPLDLIFSPNDDGNKDTLSIEQQGTIEESWNLSIAAVGGREVFNRTLRNSEPSEFVWDGRDSTRTPVADGIYTYTISARDRAGNAGSSAVENIIVDTQPTPVGITINTAYFSPNGDEVKDTIELELSIPNPAALTSWRVEVRDQSKQLQWTREGEQNPPDRLVFAGVGNAGDRLMEGSYEAMLFAEYRNGNAPSSSSPLFVLDVTRPRATLAVSSDIFSPNGDGNLDSLTITQDTSIEPEWVSRIISSRGGVVREYNWIDQPDGRIVWNGTSASGDIVEDGEYRYVLSATDRAGNSVEVSSRPVKVSTGETGVALFTSTDAFSPNGDDIKDELLLKPQVKVAEGVESYTISILDIERRPVKRYSGTRALSPDYRWDGIGDDGKRMPDGIYSAEIEVLDRNGNRARSRSSDFIIDREAPEAVVSSPYLLFSPNGDGRKDVVEISQSGSNETLWEGEILNDKGTVVRNYRWKESPGDFTWLGRDNAGNPVPDGRYNYRLMAVDAAGNSTTVTLPGLVADTRGARAYLTADESKISPNDDGSFDRITFYPIVSLNEGIDQWQLLLSAGDGTVYGRFSGEGAVPQEIVWNGAAVNGTVRDGLYTPRFEVSYLKGDNPSAELKPVRVDVTTPAVSLTAEPLPFSPDNDGIEDELSINIDVEDLSPIDNWSLEIYDRQMNLFTSFSGSGMPADSILWDGRSNTGELVIAAEDYPFRFTITDDLRNSTKVEGKFPVDVLVIREGDKLKIQIASIVFEPNTADFSERDEETAGKNTFVLDRIAQILNKYRNYRITIEGHANPVYFNDPVRGPREEKEELQPLSEKRAEAVRQALATRGVNPNRLRVVGRGGSNTIADPGNREVNWKNRRVEFILEK